LPSIVDKCGTGTGSAKLLDLDGNRRKEVPVFIMNSN
jgi:hypothetical protein